MRAMQFEKYDAEQDDGVNHPEHIGEEPEMALEKKPKLSVVEDLKDKWRKAEAKRAYERNRDKSDPYALYSHTEKILGVSKGLTDEPKQWVRDMKARNAGEPNIPEFETPELSSDGDRGTRLFQETDEFAGTTKTEINNKRSFNHSGEADASEVKTKSPAFNSHSRKTKLVEIREERKGYDYDAWAAANNKKNWVRLTSKINFKRNINFLEKPLFVASRTRVEMDEYCDGRGYEIRCKTGLPVSYDIDVLNYLVYKSQYVHGNELDFHSMKDLLDALKYSNGMQSYLLIMESLDRWANTEASFKNDCFYLTADKSITIDKVRFLTLKLFNGQRRFVVKMDPDFMEYNSKRYSKVIPVELMQQLTPHSKRLYEILSKNDTNLYNQEIWPIGIDKLRRKLLTATEKTDSKILYSVKESIKQINEVIPVFGLKYLYKAHRDARNPHNIRFQRYDFNIRGSQDKSRS
jgi:hypothetical protein